MTGGQIDQTGMLAEYRALCAPERLDLFLQIIRGIIIVVIKFGNNGVFGFANAAIQALAERDSLRHLIDGDVRVTGRFTPPLLYIETVLIQNDDQFFALVALNEVIVQDVHEKPGLIRARNNGHTWFVQQLPLP